MFNVIFSLSFSFFSRAFCVCAVSTGVSLAFALCQTIFTLHVSSSALVRVLVCARARICALFSLSFVFSFFFLIFALLLRSFHYYAALPATNINTIFAPFDIPFLYSGSQLHVVQLCIGRATSHGTKHGEERGEPE